MQGVIKGIYNKGHVILEEIPETEGPIEVFVTFPTDFVAEQPKEHSKRVFGLGKGLVLYMSPDFNEPLEDLKDYM